MQQLHKGNYSGNIIDQHIGAGLICCHTSYNEQLFNGTRHFHDNAHLSLVLSGTCAEKKKEVYQRNPGHVTFYHAGEPHQVLGVSGASRHINLEIESAFFKHFDITEQNIDLAVRSSPDAVFILLQMYREMQLYDDVANLSIESSFLQLMNGPAGDISRSNVPMWVKKTEDYLQANALSKITLSILAAEVGAHPVTISRYFQKYWGCTLGRYIRKLKIIHTLPLIKSGEVTLSEVAFKCGFADQSHFIRTFKQFTGLLPAVYQNI